MDNRDAYRLEYPYRLRRAGAQTRLLGRYRTWDACDDDAQRYAENGDVVIDRWADTYWKTEGMYRNGVWEGNES